MKLARIRTKSGGIAHVSVESDSSGQIVTGDLASGFTPTGERVPIVDFLPPGEPPPIFAIGQNYRAHAEELGNPIPTLPLVFIKSINSLSSHRSPIELPRGLESTKVDYECELAVVIGKAAKNVREEDALNHVFGYTIANDVSARDWQKEFGQGQFCQGKSFDTFCPLGPWIVTADEIPDPQALRLSARLNGETVQDSSASDMIFSVARLVSFLSGSKTLYPGTVILTGTPSGVGAGRKPPLYLKPGDEVELSIESIGTLSNPVVEEKLG